jgi:hypothetical protein
MKDLKNEKLLVKIDQNKPKLKIVEEEYGLGLVHLIGSNSIVLTSLLRQLIDNFEIKNIDEIKYD